MISICNIYSEVIDLSYVLIILAMLLFEVIDYIRIVMGVKAQSVLLSSINEY